MWRHHASISLAKGEAQNELSLSLNLNNTPSSKSEALHLPGDPTNCAPEPRNVFQERARNKSAVYREGAQDPPCSVASDVRPRRGASRKSWSRTRR
mmetsp:Transcript_16848/g.58806  ORF Transcript_16848/g.58806 Transcript_16848/m.58806 type:complete len:96 (-) Transcript_16848:3336-3623(-)